MTSVFKKKRSPWLVLAALFASVSAAPALAYTPEQQQACTPDAMRLCGSFVPDVDRITACMIQKKSQLSPECRRYFRPDPEPRPSAAVGPPTNIRPVARKPASAKPVAAKSASAKSASAKSASAKSASAKSASAKAKKPKKPAKPADT